MLLNNKIIINKKVFKYCHAGSSLPCIRFSEDSNYCGGIIYEPDRVGISIGVFYGGSDEND